MPISSPSVTALGSDLGLGNLLDEQARDEELKRRKKLGLSAQAAGSPTVQGLLNGMGRMGSPGFNAGGFR